MRSQGMHGWFLDEKIYVVVHIIFYFNEKGILVFLFHMYFNLFMLTDVSLG
jgi:hypothetical protein